MLALIGGMSFSMSASCIDEGFLPTIPQTLEMRTFESHDWNPSCIIENSEAIEGIQAVIFKDDKIAIESYSKKENLSDFQKKRDFLQICSIERDKQMSIVKDKKIKPEVRKTIG